MSLCVHDGEDMTKINWPNRGGIGWDSTGKQNPSDVGHPISQRPPLPFVIGETYADRVGEYKVISVEGNKMVFEYTDGRRCNGQTETKALIYRNILLEEKFSHVIQRKKRLKSQS